MRRRREEVLQNFFSSLKIFWRRFVRISEEGDPTKKNKENAGNITSYNGLKKFIPSFVFLPSHENREKGTRGFAFVLCVLFLPRVRGLTPSEAMRCE